MSFGRDMVVSSLLLRRAGIRALLGAAERVIPPIADGATDPPPGPVSIQARPAGAKPDRSRPIAPGAPSVATASVGELAEVRIAHVGHTVLWDWPSCAGLPARSEGVAWGRVQRLAKKLARDGVGDTPYGASNPAHEGAVPPGSPPSAVLEVVSAGAVVDQVELPVERGASVTLRVRPPALIYDRTGRAEGRHVWVSRFGWRDPRNWLHWRGRFRCSSHVSPASVPVAFVLEPGELDIEVRSVARLWRRRAISNPAGRAAEEAAAWLGQTFPVSKWAYSTFKGLDPTNWNPCRAGQISAIDAIVS
jgi:hypothetical protein